MRPNIETHYKDITSHFQKADNNLHESTPIYTYRHGYLHQSTPIDMDIYTNLHKAVLRLSRLFSWQI